MGKIGKYHYTPKDPPTKSFPYKIPTRINILSYPRRSVFCFERLPIYTPHGVRMSALRANISDRVLESSWPPVRRLLITKRQYKRMFPPERLEVIDKYINISNGTMYSKLANTSFDSKSAAAAAAAAAKKKKGWSDNDWKKHMEYIGRIAEPRHIPDSYTPERGDPKPLLELLPSIQRLANMPPHKRYIRPSQDTMFKDPTKVSENAKKYVVTEHIKRLAKPREYPE